MFQLEPWQWLVVGMLALLIILTAAVLIALPKRKNGASL